MMKLGQVVVRLAGLVYFLTSGCALSPDDGGREAEGMNVTVSRGPTETMTMARVPSWAATMQSMSRDVERLLPFVVSRREFTHPKNRAQILGLMESYRRNVAAVPVHVGEKLYGDDPMIRYSLSHLREDVAQAVRAMKEGHFEFARTTLRQSMATCFNCHSTQQLGPEYGEVTANGALPGARTAKLMLPSPPLNAPFQLFPTERAEYYVAMRQFDRALDILEGILINPGAFFDEPHEQATALKKYLALMVRVRKDPVRAAGTLEKFLRASRLPLFLAADAETWLRSLRAWADEKAPINDPLKKARELMRAGEGGGEASGGGVSEYLPEEGRGFQSGYVEILRATALLHDALKSTKLPEVKAEIYRLLGGGYDIISDLGLWDLPEVYFEECIRTLPRSPLARRCYREYERAIILGYSGSAGVFIPKEERIRLARLKKLAGVK